MKIIETTILSTEQKVFIFKTWNKEYPKSLSFKTIADLDNYFSTLAGIDFFLLQNDNDKLEGWAIKFGRDDEKWFAITIDSAAQGHGKGTTLLNKLKENENVLNGWVIDHDNNVKQNEEAYRSPVAFYLKNGFAIYPELRLEIPILSAAKIVWRR